jgi:hypothetical protein
MRVPGAGLNGHLCTVRQKLVMARVALLSAGACLLQRLCNLGAFCNEDVLIEGNHEWLVYSENQQGWNHLGSFTTTLTQNQRPNLPHRAI